MADTENEGEHRLIEFDGLNTLGKAVYLAGAAVRTTAWLIETVLEGAADLVVEAERAFLQGRDPQIEDAKILEEHEERRKG